MSSAQRGADIAGALAGLVVFAPVMAVVAIAIRLDDGGDVFFRQRRLGAGRRPFTILKFRSMREGRVTRVGRVLRDCGLDELPQFFNILRGDMSAVGPRPLTAEDVARLGWTGPSFDFRWECRPGLIGLAQLLGARADADALEFDRVHVAGRNPALEVELIAWAFAVNVFGKARVRAWLRRRYAMSDAYNAPASPAYAARHWNAPRALRDSDTAWRRRNGRSLPGARRQASAAGGRKDPAASPRR